MNIENEDSLIRGLQAGCRVTFQRAVEYYSGSMLATARTIAGPANAEDIVQDAWLTVYQKVGAFEQRASFNTWLQRIVANRAISFLRARSREVNQNTNTIPSDADWFDATGKWTLPPSAWHTDSPDALLSAKELETCISKQLQDMPDDQRSVLVLRDIEQRNFEEICNELNLTASNARVLLHRARIRLMNMVNRYEETGSC